eukprot:g604.t1
MASYWRVAGLNYLQYLQVCSATMRSALKQPAKQAAEARGVVHFREAVQESGRRGNKVVVESYKQEHATMASFASFEDLRTLMTKTVPDLIDHLLSCGKFKNHNGTNGGVQRLPNAVTPDLAENLCSAFAEVASPCIFAALDWPRMMRTLAMIFNSQAAMYRTFQVTDDASRQFLEGLVREANANISAGASNGNVLPYEKNRLRVLRLSGADDNRTRACHQRSQHIEIELPNFGARRKRSCLKIDRDLFRSRRVTSVVRLLRTLDSFYRAGGIESVVRRLCYSFRVGDEATQCPEMADPGTTKNLLFLLNNISEHVSDAFRHGLLFSGQRSLPWLIVVCQSFTSLSPQQMRRSSFADVLVIISLLDDLYAPYANVCDVNAHLNRLQVRTAAAFLRCSFFQQRLQGLNALRNRVNSALERDGTSAVRAYDIGNDDAHWELPPMRAEELCDMLRELSIVPLLLGGDTAHPEILKRSADILNFLAAHDQFEGKHISMLWDVAARAQSHESVRYAVYDIVEAMCLNWKRSHLELLFERIASMPIERIDRRLLVIVSKLSWHLLNHDHLLERESESARTADFVSDDGGEKIAITARANAGHVPPGLMLLWKLQQDDSELTDVAIFGNVQDSFVRILRWPKMFCFHDTIFSMCVDALRRHASVPQALYTISTLIEMYPADADDASSKCAHVRTTRTQLVQRLLRVHDLKRLFYTDLRHRTRPIVEDQCKKDLRQCRSFYSESTDMHARLHFIRVLFDSECENVTIDSAELDLLWTCFVEEAHSPNDMDFFLLWLRRLHGDASKMDRAGSSLSCDTVERVVRTKMPSLAMPRLSVDSFECFRYFFEWLNCEKGVFERNSAAAAIETLRYCRDRARDISIRGRSPIAGFDTLWRVVMEASNEVVIRRAIRLLRDVHRAFLGCDAGNVEAPRDCDQFDPMRCVHECMRRMKMGASGMIASAENGAVTDVPDGSSVSCRQQVLRCLQILLSFVRRGSLNDPSLCSSKASAKTAAVGNIDSATANDRGDAKVSVKFMFFSLEMSRRQFESDFPLTMTVGDLRKYTAEVVQRDRGPLSNSAIHPNELRMISGGRELFDDSLTLSQCKFGAHSKVQNVHVTKRLLERSVKVAHERSAADKSLKILSGRYFRHIYDLLKFCFIENCAYVAHEAWALLKTLPTNASIVDHLALSGGIDSANEAFWAIALPNPRNGMYSYELLYKLKVLRSCAKGTIETREVFRVDTWRAHFFRSGGLKRLLTYLHSTHPLFVGHDSSSKRESGVGKYPIKTDDVVSPMLQLQLESHLVLVDIVALLLDHLPSTRQGSSEYFSEDDRIPGISISVLVDAMLQTIRKLCDVKNSVDVIASRTIGGSGSATAGTKKSSKHDEAVRPPFCVGRASALIISTLHRKFKLVGRLLFVSKSPVDCLSKVSNFSGWLSATLLHAPILVGPLTSKFLSRLCNGWREASQLSKFEVRAKDKLIKSLFVSIWQIYFEDTTRRRRGLSSGGSSYFNFLCVLIEKQFTCDPTDVDVARSQDEDLRVLLSKAHASLLHDLNTSVRSREDDDDDNSTDMRNNIIGTLQVCESLVSLLIRSVENNPSKSMPQTAEQTLHALMCDLMSKCLRHTSRQVGKIDVEASCNAEDLTQRESSLSKALFSSGRSLKSALNLLLRISETSTSMQYQLLKLLYADYEHRCEIETPSNDDVATTPKKRRKLRAHAPQSASNEIGEEDNSSAIDARAYDAVAEYRPRPWNYAPATLSRASCGYVGLQNLGVTCYFNSLMQQFFMMPKFRRTILEIEHESDSGRSAETVATKTSETDRQEKNDKYDDGNDGQRDPKRRRVLGPGVGTATSSSGNSIIRQLQLMFGYLQRSEKKFYAPDGFCSIPSEEGRGHLLNTVEQQDVDEFFRVLMDRLETELKPTRVPDMLKKLFGGVLCNQLIPQGCPREHRREREEEVYVLQLDVKNKSSILESLKSYVEGEMLDGDNKYLCETCGKKRDTLKRVCLKASALPETLIFHLKRFTFDLETLRRMKVNDMCTFPPELDMRPYTDVAIDMKRGAAASTSSSTAHFPRTHFDYDLVGVVVHTGTSESGHYFSYVKERSNDSEASAHLPSLNAKESRWLHFNDSTVETFEFDEIAEMCFGGAKLCTVRDPITQQMTRKWYARPYSAYMLIYERKRPKSESDEGAVLPEIPRQIARSIESENITFLHDKQLFSPEYKSLMLCLCKSLRVDDAPTLLATSQGSGRCLLMIKLATEYLFEILMHGRNVALCAPFVDFLCKWKIADEARFLDVCEVTRAQRIREDLLEKMLDFFRNVRVLSAKRCEQQNSISLLSDTDSDDSEYSADEGDNGHDNDDDDDGARVAVCQSKSKSAKAFVDEEYNGLALFLSVVRIIARDRSSVSCSEDASVRTIISDEYFRDVVEEIEGTLQRHATRSNVDPSKKDRDAYFVKVFRHHIETLRSVCKDSWVTSNLAIKNVFGSKFKCDRPVLAVIYFETWKHLILDLKFVRPIKRKHRHNLSPQMRWRGADDFTEGALPAHLFRIVSFIALLRQMTESTEELEMFESFAMAPVEYVCDGGNDNGSTDDDESVIVAPSLLTLIFESDDCWEEGDENKHALVGLLQHAIECSIRHGASPSQASSQWIAMIDEEGERMMVLSHKIVDRLMDYYIVLRKHEKCTRWNDCNLERFFGLFALLSQSHLSQHTPSFLGCAVQHVNWTFWLNEMAVKHWRLEKSCQKFYAIVEMVAKHLPQVAIDLLHSLSKRLRVDTIHESDVAIGVLRLVHACLRDSDRLVMDFVSSDSFQKIVASFQAFHREKRVHADARPRSERGDRLRRQELLVESFGSILLRISKWLAGIQLRAKDAPTSDREASALESFRRCVRSTELLFDMLEGILWRPRAYFGSMRPMLCEIVWIFFRNVSSGSDNLALKVGRYVREHVEVLGRSSSAADIADGEEAASVAGADGNYAIKAEEKILLEAWPDDSTRMGIYLLSKEAVGTGMFLRSTRNMLLAGALAFGGISLAIFPTVYVKQQKKNLFKHDKPLTGTQIMRGMYLNSGSRDAGPDPDWDFETNTYRPNRPKRSSDS